jgi:hypothetical protein
MTFLAPYDLPLVLGIKMEQDQNQLRAAPRFTSTFALNVSKALFAIKLKDVAMFAVATKGSGNAMSTPPDVCFPIGIKIPLPFTNVGNFAQATKACTKVKVCGKYSLFITSEVPNSTGDEAGADGGIVSGKNLEIVKFIKGSTKVLIEGKQTIMVTAQTEHNKQNTTGLVSAPSQIKVKIMP